MTTPVFSKLHKISMRPCFYIGAPKIGRPGGWDKNSLPRAEGNAGLVASNDGQLLESALRGLLQMLNQITKKGRHDVSPQSGGKNCLYTLSFVFIIGHSCP